MPVEDGKYFVTPRDLADNRMRLEVSENDYGKLVRGRVWAAEMTDIPTGRKYRLYPADCGQANCFCDAIAVEVVPNLANVAPVSGVIPMEEVLAKDEDKDAIRQAAEQAIVYCNSFTWSKAVLDSYFGGGVAGVFAVFLLHIVPARDGIGDWMWVTVGDVPPTYLPLEDAESAEMVFKTYAVGIWRWIEFARQGREGSAKDGVPPVGIKATPESAELMRQRLKSLVQIVGPLFDPQSCG
jgi:hypothetical protein